MFAMPVEPVVALLMRQSASSLKAMADEIRQQIESLSAQYRLVERALAEKDRAMAGVGNAPPQSSPRGEKRALFREILAQRPDRDWTATQIMTELQRRGVPANGAAVRVMLRRMAERGDVERTHLGWKLASAIRPDENGAVDGSSELGPETLSFAATGQEANSIDS